VLRSCGFDIQAKAGDIRIGRRAADAPAADRRTDSLLRTLCSPPA
jgi:hypothetical protein